MATDLKAYSVLETDEGTGGIVFATRKDQAIRRATSRYFDGEEPETTCERSPWADQYAGGSIPAGIMIAHGWRFECSGCHRTIDADMADLHHDMERNEDEVARGTSGPDDRYLDWTPSVVIGTQDSAIYCTSRCQEERRVKDETYARMKNRAVATFTRILLRRLPNAEPVDLPDSYGGQAGAEFRRENGVWLLHSVRVPFRYPGARHGYGALEYRPRGFHRSRQISYICPIGDTETFDAYLSTHESKEPADVE